MHDVTGPSNPQPGEAPMELEALLEQARSAPPGRRIESRDGIAAYGARAIEGVRPWLADEVLAAFAVRVIEQAGTHGEPELASKVLRAARSTVPAGVTEDVEWALQRIRLAAKPVPPPPAAPTTVEPARPPARRPDAPGRRRTR